MQNLSLSFPYLAYIHCVTFCKYHSETTYISQSASLTCGIWHSSFQLAAAFTFSNFIVNHTKLWENSWSFCYLRKQVIWESFKNKCEKLKPKMSLKGSWGLIAFAVFATQSKEGKFPQMIWESFLFHSSEPNHLVWVLSPKNTAAYFP